MEIRTWLHQAVLFVDLGQLHARRFDAALLVFAHAHSHTNLLGCVSLALVGLLYRADAGRQQGLLPQVHYWLHTIGPVVLMGGFAWRIVGGAAATPLVAAGALSVGVGVLRFASYLLLRLRSAPHGAEA